MDDGKAETMSEEELKEQIDDIKSALKDARDRTLPWDEREVALSWINDTYGSIPESKVALAGLENELSRRQL